jgi:phospholipid:diacylglycerol acyltransferase
MSTLRRRIAHAFGGSSTPSSVPSRDETPEPGEEVRLVPVSKLRTLTTRKKTKRRNGLIFGLGGLFGVVLAAFFASQNDVIRFEGLMDLNLESLVDVIPAGIVRDARDITVSVAGWSNGEGIELD